MINFRIQNISFYREGNNLFDDVSYDFSGSRLNGIITDSEESSHSFLRIIAGLLKPNNGEVFIDENSFYSLSEEEHSKTLRQNSFIFHSSGIVSNLSVLENILIPYNFLRKEVSLTEKQEKIDSLIEYFELEPQILNKRPSQLTKTEIKLINFVRGYVIEPKVIFIESPFARMNKHYEMLIENIILDYSFKKDIVHFFSQSIDSTLVNFAEKIIAVRKSKPFFFDTAKDSTNKFRYHNIFD